MQIFNRGLGTRTGRLERSEAPAPTPRERVRIVLRGDEPTSDEARRIDGALADGKLVILRPIIRPRRPGGAA